MTPDEVRGIVRDEIAKMIDESGILPALTDFVAESLTGAPIPPF